MARFPLIHIPDGIYSVVSKCNNSEFLFNANKKFELYLNHLLYCKKKLGFKIYDIVCMSNHVHELYRVPESGVTISDILHTVKGHFSQKHNTAYNRTDHFWRNKPWYRVVENEDYAFNIGRYFHANPVRAGLVKNPEEWPYSGYRFHILNDRSGVIGQLLDPFILDESYLKSDNEYNAYNEKYIASLVHGKIGRKCLRFLGSHAFIKKMDKKYNR